MNRAWEYSVIIVDDCDAFAQGLKMFLEQLPQYEVIAVFPDGKDVIADSDLGQADVVLMDINMPMVNGIEAGKRINYMFPGIKLVAITFNNDQVCLEEIVSAGFKGYVLKQSIVEDLEGVLSAVVTNQFAFPKELVLRTKK